MWGVSVLLHSAVPGRKTCKGINNQPSRMQAFSNFIHLQHLVCLEFYYFFSLTGVNFWAEFIETRFGMLWLTNVSVSPNYQFRNIKSRVTMVTEGHPSTHYRGLF